jgi:hypothetical protein
MAVAAAAAIFLAVLLNSRQSNGGLVSADDVLFRAAHAHPQPGQVVHLVYSVHLAVASSSEVRPVNVWDRYANGLYTTVDIQRRSPLAAARFVERNGMVRRSWLTHGGIRPARLGALSKSLIAGQDGRLIAWSVIDLKRSHPSAVQFQGLTTRAGRPVYVLRVAAGHARGGPFTIAFDARTFDLVQVVAPGLRDRLVSTTALSTSTAPNLVVAYMKSAKPTPASSGGLEY